MKIIVRTKGGEGSGNHGHVSVPGESGGSAAKGGTGSTGVASSPAKNKTVSDSSRSLAGEPATKAKELRETWKASQSTYTAEIMLPGDSRMARARVSKSGNAYNASYSIPTETSAGPTYRVGTFQSPVDAMAAVESHIRSRTK